MTRANATPDGESGDVGPSKRDEMHFAADPPPEIPFDLQTDPTADAVEEDPRLSSIREFWARDNRRRRRRRLIGICIVVVGGAGLVIGAFATVGRRTEQRPLTASSRPPHIAREDSEALGQSTESLLTSEVWTSVAKRSNTETERQSLPENRPAPRSSTASASRGALTSRAAAVQDIRKQHAVYPQPLARLTVLRPGDSKEKVFETLATVVERRNGALMRIEGVRLRARGRSTHHELIEIAEVRVADTAAGSLRWFLFGDGRLLQWGRPEEWATAAKRYELATEYKPAATSDERRGDR